MDMLGNLKATLIFTSKKCGMKILTIGFWVDHRLTGKQLCQTSSGLKLTNHRITQNRRAKPLLHNDSTLPHNAPYNKIN